MKCLHWQSVLMALAFGLPWMLVTESVRAAEPVPTETDAPSVEEIERDISGLNDLWKAGQRCPYFVEAAKVAERFREVRDRSKAADVAAELLETMLPRKLNVDEAAVYSMADRHNRVGVECSDLSAMSELANFISGTYDEEPATTEFWASERRRRQVKLVARFLGRVRMELDPHYKEKPIFLNIAPPLSTGEFAFAGMDPDDIKDPVARAAYLSAICENIANGMSNARQSKLGSLSDVMGPNLVNDLIQMFAVWDDSAAELAKYMNDARLTKKERAAVEDALARAKRYREREEARDKKSADSPKD